MESTQSATPQSQTLIQPVSSNSTSSPLSAKSHVRKKRNLSYILFGLVLLVVISTIIIILFWKGSAKSQMAINLNQATSADQTKQLSQAFKSGDFATVENYLALNIPDSNWISQVQNVKIVYFDNLIESSTSSAQIIVPAIVVPLQNGFEVKLSSSLKNEQPFASSAMLLQQLRGVYNLMNTPNINTSTSTYCSDYLLDTTQWSLKYWDSLQLDQRIHLAGFGDTLLNAENAKSAANKNGILKTWISQNIGKSCPENE